MKLPKTLDKIFKGAILGGALLLSPVQKADADPFPYITAQNNWVIGYGTPFLTNSQIPEYMRTVPEHSDDGDGITIIPDDSFSYNFLMGTDLRLGGGIKDRNSDIPYDFSFGFRLGADLLLGGGHEYNYTNAPGTEERGYGAALTKYSCFGLDVSFGGFAKAKLFDVGFLEYNIEVPIFQGIILRNGWDRYDNFQVKDTYSSNVPALNHIIKGGIEFSFPSNDFTTKRIGIFAGTKIPQNVFANPSNEFGITSSPNFFGGIQYTQGLEYSY